MAVRARSTAKIDGYVGLRVGERRIMLGLTQDQFAQRIGVTPQQAHKYEKGLNRISAGRLFEIGRILGVPVGYFFERVAEEGVRQVPQRERLMLEISRNLAEITDERQQEAVRMLARVLAGH